MTKQKINPNIIVVIVGIIVILFVVSKTGVIPGFSVGPDIDETPEGSCSISLNKLTFPARETITGTIQDGSFASCILYARLTGETWTTLGTFKLDSNGYYSHTEPVNTAGSYEVVAICMDEGVSCKTNIESFTVTPGATTPPIDTDDGTNGDTGYGVGDVIDTFSGSGSLPAWTNDAEFLFDLGDVDVPENCRLGARIDTYWAYESSAPCYYPGVGYEAVNWKFYDSTLVKVWDKTDYSSPSTNDVDLCPFVWDGFTPWKLEIKQTQNMQDCVIDYNYNVEVYVCACD